MPERSRRFGRTLKLFLVDGTPTGVISAELGNWSGKAVVAPRAALPELVRRDEASRTGVYLLLGADPESPGRTLVYVGESDTVKTRLTDHDADETKEFFSRVCLIVSKDQNLTKAHGRYLESRLMALIETAARAQLVNDTRPDSKGLPEAEIADMEGFLSEIEVLLPVLGFDVLRPARDAEDETTGEDAGPTFVFTQAGTDARAREIGGEFVVLAGSLARVEETASCPASVQARRRQLLEDGAIAEESDGKMFRFVRDVAFGSPSGAGSAVYGGAVNGQIHWKDAASGKSYGELRAGRFAAARGDETRRS